MSAVPKFADKKSLKNLVPLNGLSATHFEELAKKATVLELKPGKYLFKKGERDTSTCYVLDGEIALVDGSDIKLTIEGGTEEAKHPIAQQQPRQLGARAKTHCTVVSIDSGLLDVMLAWEQSTSYEVDDIESDDEDWMTRMMQSDLMQRLPATNLQQLFMRMEEVEVKAGEVVFNQDEEGDYYYIIKQGKCIVSRKPSATGRAVKLAELKDGDSFGEESLLSGGKRNASITMLTPGVLMRLAKNDFNELLKAPLLSQVDYNEAKALVAEGAIYLDVRLPGEFTNAHLSDSINIPLAAIRSDIVNIDRNKEYIVYCDTGRRSTSAVFLLGQFGIEAHVLKGGLSNVPMEEYGSAQSKETESAEIIDINRDKESAEVAQVNNVKIEEISKEKKQLEENVARLKVDLSKLKEQLAKTEKNIAKNEKEAEKTNKRVIQEQEKVQSLEEELHSLRDVEIESDKLKEQLAKAMSKAEEQEKLLESTRQSDEYAQQKMLSQQAELDGIKKELEIAQSSLSENESSGSAKQKELQAANKKLNALCAERDELAERIASQDEEKTALSRELEDQNNKLNNEMSALQKLVADLEESKLEVENLYKQDKQQLESIKNELDVRENEKNELAGQLSSLQGDYNEEQQQLALISEQKKSLEEELQALKSSYAASETESQGQAKNLQETIDAYKNERESLEKKLGESQAQVDVLQGNIEQVKQSSEASGNDNARQISELQQQVQGAHEQNQTLQQEIETLRLTQGSSEEKLRELEGSRKVAEEDARKQIEMLQSSLDMSTKEVSEKESLLEGKIKEYQENEAAFHSRIEVLEKETVEYKAQIESGKEKSDQQVQESQGLIDSLKLDIEKLVQEASASETQMQDLLKESEHTQQGLQEEIDGLVVKINEGNETLLQQQTSNEQALQQRQEAIIAFEADISNLEGSNAELRQVLENLEKLTQQYTQEIETGRNDKQALEDQLKQANDELDNIRNVLSNANLNKDDLESRYQQQYEQFKTDRENLEEQLRHAQNRIDELSNLSKQLELDKNESREVANQFETVNAELETLRNALSSAGAEKEEAVSLHQQQYTELQNEHEKLKEQLSQTQGKLGELEKANERLEAARVDESDSNELDKLRVSLEEVQEKLQASDELLAKKTQEDEITKNELIALRAVYVQKEEDVARLQKEVEMAKELSANVEVQEGAISEEMSALEQELKLVRDRYEQAEKESSELLDSLEGSVREKEQLIETYVEQVDEAARLKSDAESAYKVMESEVDKLRNDHEGYQINITESHKKIEVLQFELEAMKAEQADNRSEEEKQALLVDLEANKARVGELESELQKGREEIKRANEKIDTQVASIQEQQQKSIKEVNLQSQIEQLKLEMKTQMDVYKTEVNNNASNLTKENETLRKELEGLRKQKEEAARTAVSVEAETDHSALFDLPDIDKNLFGANADRVPPKSSMLTSIVLALVLSLLSAGGVYWYFVMGNKQNAVDGILTNESPANGSTVTSGSLTRGTGNNAKPVSGKSIVSSSGNTVKSKASAKPAKKQAAGKLKPSRIFSDFLATGGKGPVMVGVPSGIFSMGSPSNSTHFEERPQHTVSLRKFSISKHEVSFADYDQFAEATGRSLPADNGWGRGNRPVINVTWDDAVAYAEWLSEQTGHQYRLPSEAEWEYAARAGTQDKYWWGATLEHKRANCFNCGSEWDRISSAPTGSFSASSLGLHDMTGNVMEWVSDCYHANYDGAPIDGSAWTGTCKSRVVRGGSYRSTADDIRVTKRSEFSHDSAVDHIGFRIVRQR